MKSCSKCKEVKPFKDFHKLSRSKDGYKPSCKACIKVVNKMRYDNNKERFYEVGKRYRQNNRDKVNEASRKYYSNNKEYCNAKSVRWQVKNKDYIRVKSRERSKYKSDTDPIFKRVRNSRANVRKCLNRGSISNLNEIGCTFEHLVNHLNNNPYGFKWNDKDIDIDHIITISNGEQPYEELVKWSNLQLLPSYYNRYIKKDKEFNKKDLEEWLKKQ